VTRRDTILATISGVITLAVLGVAGAMAYGLWLVLNFLLWLTVLAAG